GGGVGLTGAAGLMGHQPREPVTVPPLDQILLADAELLEVLPGDVDPPGPRVDADVAHDVRELQRGAELHRVVARARIGVAEDLDAAEADRRGAAVAVGIEVLGRVVADAPEAQRGGVADRPKRRGRTGKRAPR